MNHSARVPAWRLIALVFAVSLFGKILYASADAPASDEKTPLRLRSVQVGIEGYYKNGLWTPILLEWESDRINEGESCDLELECTDSDGTPIRYRNITTRLETAPSAPSTMRTRFYARLGRKEGPLTIRLTVKDVGSIEKRLVPAGQPERQPKSSDESLSDPIRFFLPVPAERPIYLVIGDENIGLQGAIAELAFREDRRPILVKVNSISALPELACGLEAVDMIVLTTTQPTFFEGLKATSPPIMAMDDWIRLGGRLFFCAGKDAGPFLEKEDGPLRPFLPGRFERMTDLRQGTRLEAFVGSKRQIFMNGTPDAPFMEMPLFSDPRGIVILNEIDLSLVLRCAHGFGTIVYFGGDLSGKPLSLWRDRVPLVRKILQWDKEKQGGGRGNVSLIQLGYNDIAGQVRSALDHFDGVRIVPFSLMLIILAIYWLVVGPLDWVIVQKVFKRPALTWITFPFWIVAFCFLAYALGAPGRPNRVMLNELDLIDLDAESGAARLSSWGNLYSPADARHTLGLSTHVPENVADRLHSSYFSWNGLPGSGLGGMAPKTVSPTVWQTGSVQHPFDPREDSFPKIEDVPIQVRSTKSFFGQSFFHLDQGALNRFARSELADEEGIPIGKIEFGPNMPSLDNCILAYGMWIQELGAIEPGQVVSVGKVTPRRELRDILLSKEALEDESLRRVVSYNTESTDLERITRVLSLFEVLGGFESIGLYNSYQRSLDMSDLFTVDRAILIGTVRDPDKVSVRAGIVDAKDPNESFQGNRTSLLRYSFPIKLTELSPRLKIKRQILTHDERLEAEIKLIRGPGEYKLEQPGSSPKNQP